MAQTLPKEQRPRGEDWQFANSGLIICHRWHWILDCAIRPCQASEEISISATSLAAVFHEPGQPLTFQRYDFRRGVDVHLVAGRTAGRFETHFGRSPAAGIDPHCRNPKLVGQLDLVERLINVFLRSRSTQQSASDASIKRAENLLHWLTRDLQALMLGCRWWLP